MKPHSTASNLIAATSTSNAYVIDIERKSVDTIFDLPVGNLSCTNNGIQASSSYLAFHVEGEGGKLGAIPVGTKGRRLRKDISIICAHGGIGEFIDKGNSLDWSEDGKLLAISADKGRQICIYDVRADTSPIQKLDVHQGLGRESRVLFCGDRLLSSGFTNKRTQEVQVLDMGKLDKPIHIQEYVSATGILMPFYDPDTELIFLVGKGTNKIFMAEFRTRVPYLSPVYEMSMLEQNLGACLGSKRCVSVMDGEVDTLYQLTKHSIIPLPCIVPRRSYRDFHADLFPDTRGPKEGCTADEWLSGSNAIPSKISLAPISTSTRQSASQSSSGTHDNLPVAVEKEIATSVPVPFIKPESHQRTSSVLQIVDNGTASESNIVSHHKPAQTLSGCQKSEWSTEGRSIVTSPPAAPIRIRQWNRKSEVSGRSISARIRPKSCVVGQIASKFRHVELKSNSALFTNLRNVNTQLPLETNGACVSGKFIAVPLRGPAGIVGIYDISKPGKLPDGVMDGIFNKALVTDLHWNPFNDEELAISTDVGIVNFWRLRVDDGPRNEMQPEKVMNVGREKILCFQFHPMASDLLALALSNNSIEIWESNTLSRRVRIVTHSAAVMALAWSSDGHRLVSVGKDLMLNVHQPQLGDECLIAQKKVLERGHSGRLFYACDDRLIVIVGMTRNSSRQVQLLDSSSLEEIYTQQIDSGTQPLIPFYDYDSSVVFLSGKGSRIINMYEICYDFPYLLPLSPYIARSIGQAIAFHNKKMCDVMAVEFQRAWRISEKTIEQLVFRVPRVKKDLFQSDLFPDALVTWRPVMTAEEWLSGSMKTPQFESLKPDGVGILAQSAPLSSRVSSAEKICNSKIKAPLEKQMTGRKVVHCWSTKIEGLTATQDDMEGVSEQEWAEAS
ncbi:WD domain, G-beta repeat protein [Dictyocaulus viviparus]|uniref:Coronin-7 n=1 Tax=Dictyocaulus viviparus TaxID=29172 RepID=A0A0D8XMX1_DICVI|nr:WD domain, G-beta repeat protein [Dictyocaulus viviparus]